MKIATNIYQEISENEKKDIIDSFKKISDVEIFEYREKGISVEEIVKFLIQDLNLFKIIRNGVIFSAFRLGIKTLWNLARDKRPKSKVQGWIIIDSINIILPNEGIDETLNSLPKILEGIKKDKKYWITFENGSWKVTKL